MRTLLFIACLLFVHPVIAQAQQLASVTFGPSPDHAAQVSGQAVVARYDGIIETQATPPVTFATLNLGKPAPAGTPPVITLTNVPLPLPLVPGTTYVMRVIAVGPGGSSSPAVSNPFSVAVPVPVPAAPTAVSVKP